MIVSLSSLLSWACGFSNPEPSEPGGYPPFVSEFQIVPAYDAGTPIDNGVSIPLQVTAVIPGMRAGTRAYVSTSAGTVGGQPPGQRATLFLSSTGASEDEGLVEGEILLELPKDKRAWVEAQIADFSAGVLVLPAAERADDEP